MSIKRLQKAFTLEDSEGRFKALQGFRLLLYHLRGGVVGNCPRWASRLLADRWAGFIPWPVWEERATTRAPPKA